MRRMRRRTSATAATTSSSSSGTTTPTTTTTPTALSPSTSPTLPPSSTATSSVYALPSPFHAPRLRRASRLQFDMVVASQDDGDANAGPSNDVERLSNVHYRRSSDGSDSCTAAATHTAALDASGPPNSQQHIINTYSDAHTPSTHAPRSAVQPFGQSSHQNSQARRHSSLDSPASSIPPSPRSAQHGGSGLWKRRSIPDLAPLKTTVSSLVDGAHTRASSPTGSFTSALSPISSASGLDDHHSRDMSHLHQRRLTVGASAAASARSSISQYSPIIPPSDSTQQTDEPASITSAIAGPSRPAGGPSFSWFGNPTEQKASKSDDGNASDDSEQERKARAKAKRRQAKGMHVAPVAVMDEPWAELPTDPNNLLPLSASPSHISHTDLSNSPRTSVSSGWGTRSYASSSGAEDEGSPSQSTFMLHYEDDGYRPGPSTWRAPRPRHLWPRDLLRRFLKSNTSSPAQEYLSYQKRVRSERSEQRRGINAQRRKRVLGSTWLGIAINWIIAERWMVVLLLTFTLIFGICLGCTIKYNLDPDNMALPWRDYCTASHPTLYSLPPSSNLEPAVSLPGLTPLVPLTPEHRLWPYDGYTEAPFVSDLNGSRIDDDEPATIFLAVFSYDKGKPRRDLIRQSYNIHPRSRTPGTEGVRLRFLMGQPRPELAQAIKDEQAEHNDIVMLDIEENMNSGKTHEYFSWAATHARVPDYEYPSHPRTPESAAEFAAAIARGEKPRPILRGEKAPDFIAKADDDAFLMLGEFERHLRAVPKTKAFWGYLVRELFMAGECYAMSRDLAEWIRDTPELDKYTHGKEDKLVSRWFRMHPNAQDIIWATEHCWIYDHPKAGTVYSHGFLYPSEVATVREEQHSGIPIETTEYRQKYARNPNAYSSVSRFGARYRPPVRDLRFTEQVEALVEGSELSKMRDRSVGRPRRSQVAGLVNQAMDTRPTREERFLGSKVGGTVLIHFIKKNEWFRETAEAMLGA